MATETQNMNTSGSSPMLLSAKSVISLLDEQQLAVCAHAINQLLSLVDYFWFEISDAIPRLEALTKEMSDPSPVWLLLAKVHFHLGEYGKSVFAALKAGDLFDLSEVSPFVQTIVAKAIDQYVAAREELSVGGGDLMVDPALESLVDRMIAQCTQKGQVAQAIGIAIDAHRLDVVKAILESEAKVDAGRFGKLTAYARQIAMRHVTRLSYQMELLGLIVSMASTAVSEPDYIFIADCLVAMGDAPNCAALITNLLAKTSAPTTKATLLQIAFNVSADASQHFIKSVIDAVRSGPAHPDREVILEVLGGSVGTEICLEFLCRNNRADMAIMEKTKECLNAHNSMHHSVLSCSNAIMHCGTTNDEFMRKNLDWLSYASNWAKFTAASSLGVVHKGQLGKGRDILKPYLPVVGEKGGSVYAEGGSLFALGLISAGRGDAADVALLRTQIQASQEDSREDVDVLLHGATLGLGVSAMSTGNQDYVQDIKGVLYRDMAQSGESAALGIGLILHGSGDLETVNEILLYASETQHEKSQRGSVLAIALIFAGLREKADTIISQLLASNNPIFRYGAIWTIASAYAGSSDNGAVARLLHLAVSDVNEDVCRVAVMALGFVLCRTPDELPKIIELLTESYNPHVRYGAAMALGIAFAGSGNKLAIELIKPMAKDFTDFVRQGAYIALAMIMMLHNEVTCDEVSWARGLFETVIGVKHEDAMAKFGAVLAQGIIDAGGRNSIISLLSPSPAGHVNHVAVAGSMLFCQFWYWYPFTNFLSLALRPTALLAVDESLRRPKMEVICKARPSRFALPPPIKSAVSVVPKKLVTAILSTTAKAAARAKKTGKSTDNMMDMMDVDGGKSSTRASTPAPPAAAMDVDTGATNPAANDNSNSNSTAEETINAPPTPEPESFTISNFNRLTPTQLPFTEFPSHGKYQPVGGASSWNGELIVLVDKHPEMPAEYLEMTTIDTKSSDGPTTDSDVKAPAPFALPDYLKNQ